MYTCSVHLHVARRQLESRAGDVQTGSDHLGVQAPVELPEHLPQSVPVTVASLGPGEGARTLRAVASLQRLHRVRVGLAGVLRQRHGLPADLVVAASSIGLGGELVLVLLVTGTEQEPFPTYLLVQVR